MPRPPDSNPRRGGQPGRTGSQPSSGRKVTGRGAPTERAGRAGRAEAGKSARAGKSGQAGGAKRGAARAQQQPDRGRRADATPPRKAPVRKGWGSVARKGARVVGERGDDAERATESASAAWRAAMARARDDEAVNPRAPWQPEQWIEDDGTEDDGTEEAETERANGSRRAARGTAAGTTGPTRAAGATPATARPARNRTRIPPAVADQVSTTVGAKRAPRVVDRLADATRAYERDRFQDARRILKPLADEAPQVAAVRQLFGLIAYRLGRWKEAVRELEAYQSLTGSADEHPVLADSYRALGRHDRVDQLWEELRATSPSAEAVAEGRIVEAGSLADRGQLQEAIRLLEKTAAPKRHPKEHHLRQWYALADLYERTGDIPRARDLFNRIAAKNPESFDVDDRLAALR